MATDEGKRACVRAGRRATLEAAVGVTGMETAVGAGVGLAAADVPPFLAPVELSIQNSTGKHALNPISVGRYDYGKSYMTTKLLVRHVMLPLLASL